MDGRHDLRGSWCLCVCNEKSLKIFDQKSHTIKSVFHEDTFRHGKLDVVSELELLSYSRS